MSPPATSQDLRAAWLDFFAARGHTVVPSASVIPVDKTILFTVAGMVPFKPYFTGDEKPPYPRAASIQRTIRAGGKHNDLDDIGRTNRHFSFFEMLGNFSFGDYFKREAIAWAWELVTDGLAIDPDRLWATVHESDDEAEALWASETDLPAARVQRLGEQNFWRMGDTGPCGPSSELFFDLGPEHGPDGGPAVGGENRFIELWNLVFMQYDQRPDGEQVPLPRRCIDTGAGMERFLAVLQGKPSAWDTDAFAPLVATAADVTGATLGLEDETDVSLRIIADHSRSLAVMVSDGVVPSNEERGYVLRRIIRRAVRHAYRVGAREHVTPPMIDAVVHSLGAAYPDLVQNHQRIVAIAEREEARFLDTLQRGLDMLDELLAKGDVSGHDAFFLHDTLGFPVDLTREIAEERGRQVDLDTFTSDMAEQRRRAKEAHREAGGAESAPVELYREIVEEHGPTVFSGREETSSPARVLAIVDGGERVGRAGEGDEVDVVLDRTPYYAESGGQVGDTGELRAAGDGGALATVLDTQYGLPQQLHVHRVRIRSGELREGDDVVATIDTQRRDAIRRHHTATHLLHWALREVLGDSAQQAGSLVAPDRLRFDFSHHEPVSREQLDEIEALVNEQVLSDAPVRHYETARDDAFAKGALAFFGEKYGDTVRVLEAGDRSIELCGGTHVPALGFIGTVKIVSEGSIGSNLRRIEAVAGEAALDRINDEERTLRSLADLLRASPGEVETKVQRLVDQVRSLQQELDSTRAKAAVADAADLAAGADDGVVVARRDGLDAESLGRLAQATVQSLGTGIVGVIGASSDATKAGLAVAVSADLQAQGISAADVARPAVRALGGGTGKSTDLVVGGGKNVDAIDDALELLTKSAAEGRA